MASKLEIILSAKNEASGPINKVKDSLDGLAGMAKTTVVAAGVAAAGAVTGIVGAIGVGVGKAADLQQGIADIASVMGITYDEAKPLGDLITQLGIDPKLKVDAVGASEAIMQLAQSGMSMTDILNGAAKSTVLLSNATGGDMATSAAVASDAMSLFGISATNMQSAVNGITGVTVASKFGIQDYQYALAAAGGVASAVGVDFNDFNTAITAIAPSFAGGSDAGTSFKTFLSRLVPQSKDAEEAMRSLGIITEDGSNRFYDASGNLKSMADISGILQEATKGLTEEQKNSTLAVIFGSDAIRAATGLAKVGSDGFTELAGSIAKVDADKSASTRMNTFSGQLEILQGVIDGLLTQIGAAFLPILQKFTAWATEFLTDHGPEITGWFEDLAKWIDDVSPAITSFANTALGAFGEIAAWMTGQDTNFENLNKLWDGLKKAGEDAVQGILDFATDHGPEWGREMMKWANGAWEWITRVAAPWALWALGQLWTTFWTWVNDNKGAWGDNFNKWAGGTWEWLTTEAIPGTLKVLGDLWNTFSKWVDDNKGPWGDAFNKWVDGTWKWITEDAAPKVKTELDKLWDGTIKPWLNTNGNGLGNELEKWAGKFTKLTDDIKNGFTLAWPQIEATIGDSQKNISRDLLTIKDSIQGLLDLISGPELSGSANVWHDVWLNITKVLSWSVTNTVSQLANLLSGLLAIAEGLKALSAGDVDGLRAALDRMKPVVESIHSKDSEILGWIGSLFSQEFSGLMPRAAGGPVNAGSRYLVGERGPELFVPKTSGTIVPNGVGTTVNNTYNVYVTGSGNAGRDVMQQVQTLQALYG